jgi:hypothetical protein
MVEIFVSLKEAHVRLWLKEALPGEELRYFEGHLAPGTDATGRPLPELERQAVARVADRLWRAAQRGAVHLVQRRRGPAHWTYIAIARSQATSACRGEVSFHTEMGHVEA